MSISSRIDDALFLWDNGRLEGAFLSALAAVAATSRRQFPDRKLVKDGEAFELFLAGTSSIRITVEYRGEFHSVEHVLYKWFRCELVHEGGIPVDIQFMPDTQPGARTIRAGGAPEYILKVSHGWFHHLINAVIKSPVNADEFARYVGPGI